MISLDEDMVGSDASTVIVAGLKVCLGLWVKLGNGTLLGAHFTPATPLNEINLMLGHINVAAAGNIVWMGAVAKFSSWAGATCGITTIAGLLNHFRGQVGYAGPVTYANLTWGAPSYDIKCWTGITPILEYRPTPNPVAVVGAPNANVFKVTGAVAKVLSHCGGGGHPGAIHNLPASMAGFARLSEDLQTHP